MSGKNAETLAELEESENVQSAELIDTLKIYARGGWKIRSDIVRAIIDRTGVLNESDKDQLRWILRGGIANVRTNRLGASSGTVIQVLGEYTKILSILS